MDYYCITMNIYLFPTECESEPFRKLRPEARVVISGVGMVETSATLMRLYTQGDIHEDDVVVLCGIAGSYDEELKVDSVVEVVEECCVELPARFRQSYTNSCATSLRGVRSNTVHTSVRSAEGAQVENMEGAALFAFAQTTGVRVAEIRAISNMVGEDSSKWNIAQTTTILAKELIRLYP